MKLNHLAPGKGFEKRRRWCGPAALAIITGRTLKHCHRLLAEIRGIDQRYLKGVWNSEMRRALYRMGFDAVRTEIPFRKTLRQYVEEHQTTAAFRSVVLVNVTDHYVVAHRGKIADNHEAEPTPVGKHPASRKLVRYAWVIRPRAR